MEKEYVFCPLCGGKLARQPVEGKQRGCCAGCGWIDYKNPLPVATALAVDVAGKVLVIKRGIEPSKGRWSLPGGFVESGETPEEACLRELYEETGVKGTVAGLLGVFNRYSPGYGEVLVVCYKVSVSDATISVNKEEIEDAVFCDRENLPEIYSPVYKKIVADFFAAAISN